MIARQGFAHLQSQARHSAGAQALIADGSQPATGEAIKGWHAFGSMGVAVEGRVGLPKGTLLDGSYRIERVIGSGGFGITYEAEDVKLGTKVAIKEYYPEEFGYRDASSERAAEVRDNTRRPSNGVARASCRRRARSPASGIRALSKSPACSRRSRPRTW